MSKDGIIVTYDRIVKAINHDEAVSERAVADVAGSSEEEVKMRLKLNAALVKLDQENDKVQAYNGSPKVMIAPDHRDASLLQSFLAEQSAHEEKLDPIDIIGGLEAKFDEKDWARWAKSFFTYWKGLFPHDFPEAPDKPDEIPDTARVALLADWGTGMYGAPDSARSIERDPEGYKVLMHLGDVYYSGTEKEEQRAFLDVWPKVSDSINRACNSNHEMYTGGHAYFELALKDKRFNQPASYFALQNKNWVLVGLDTAYAEWDFYGYQVEWLNRIIKSAGNRKIILFSHHQLFSLFDNLSNSWLGERIASLLTEKKIFAWYWGHEHRCILFNQHPSWGLYGRCIGHGGFPYFRDNLGHAPVEASSDKTSWRKLSAKHMAPSGLILDGPNSYVVGHADEYGVQGYFTLELNGEQLNEIVHTPDGARIYERRLI